MKICPNCTADVSDESVSCRYCGTDLTQPPAYHVYEPVKTGKGLKTKIAVISAAVLATAGILAAVMLNVNLSYDKAEKLFLLKAMSSEPLFDAFGISEGGTVTVKYTPGEYFLNFFKNAGITGEINPSEFTLGIIASEESASANFAVNSGKTEIVAGEAWYNSKEVVALIPELSDYYFKYDIFDELTSPPNSKEMQKIYSGILDEYFKMTKNSKVEKGGEVSIGDVSVKADMTEIKLSAKDVFKLLLSAADVLEDSEIADYMSEVNESFSFDNLRDAVEETLDEMDEDIAEATVFTMKVYVKGKDIIKREIALKDPVSGTKLLTFEYGDVKKGAKREQKLVMTIPGGKTGFTYAYGSDGKTYKRNFKMESFGETPITLKDSGNIKGGACEGKAKLTVESGGEAFEASCDYSDVKFNKEGRLISGEFALETTVNGNALSIGLTAAKDNYVCEIGYNGKEALTLDVKWEKGFKPSKMPNSNKVDCVDLKEPGNADQDVLDKIYENSEGIYELLKENPDFIYGLTYEEYDYGGIADCFEYFSTAAALFLVPEIPLVPMNGFVAAVGTAIIVPTTLNYINAVNSINSHNYDNYDDYDY